MRPTPVDSPFVRDRIKDLEVEFGSATKAMDFFLNRQPTDHFGTPAEVAGLCAYLAFDEAEFITGQAIGIDGGLTT